MLDDLMNILNDCNADIAKEGKTKMTQKAQHTPGPWIIQERDDYGWRIDIKNEDGKLDVRIDNPYEHAFSVEKPEVCDDFQPEVEANARLVASAPDLLRALEALLGAWQADPGNIRDDGPHWRNARKAIAKSKGE